MSAGSFDAWLRRWLEEHPERPGEAGVDGVLRRTAEELVARSPAMREAQVDFAAFGFAVLGVDLAREGDRTVITIRRGDELEVLEDCERIPEQLCDSFGRTCGSCPGFVAWRRTVRAPYEVGR